MHNLYHHLLRLDCGEYIGTDGFLLHIIAEFLGNFVADIGVEQCSADFLEGF